jgi:UDP-N-acetylmuramate: L-alanyl-gamma-D-glutamyl-meso-diaminopimelate ligase
MHIHILGIAGTMTAPLAVALKKQGHTITGSDQEKIYPPVSTILKKAKISINSTNIDKNIDLAIIGSSYNSFEKTKTEFSQIKKLKIPFISATDYIAQNLIKDNSILIAGSFGKTTITSLLSWIFIKAKKNPNFMFGGDPKNKFNPVNFSSSDWSIIEADESIHGLDKKAKFLYYPVKYLVLTSADWEHKDSYSKEINNFNAFKKLVLNIPKDGLLLINNQSPSAKKISLYANCPVITYNSSNSDYFIDKIKIKNNLTTLVINTPKGLIKIDTQLIGQFNFENILATVALSDYFGLNIHAIKQAVFSFRGIKRRLELISNSRNILFFDDFAQSPPRIKSVLEAIQTQFPKRKIKVFFQPHASFSQYRQSLSGLKVAFKPASEIVLGQLKFSQNIDKKDRNTARDFKNVLGSKLIYLPLEKQIIEYYKDSLMSNDILIYMSSGGLSSNHIFHSIINNFKSHKN